MRGSDELNSSVYSVSVASANANSGMSLKQKYFIIKPNSEQQLSLEYTLTEEEYNKVKRENKRLIKKVIFVDSTSSFISNATVKIKVKKCPLGFVFRDSTCVCDVRADNHVVRYLLN